MKTIREIKINQTVPSKIKLDRFTDNHGLVIRAYMDLIKQTSWFNDDFKLTLCFIDKFLTEKKYYEKGYIPINDNLLNYFRTRFNRFNWSTAIEYKSYPKATKKIITDDKTAVFDTFQVELVDVAQKSQIQGNYINCHVTKGDVETEIFLEKSLGIARPKLTILIVDKSGKHQPVCIDSKESAEEAFHKYGLSTTAGDYLCDHIGDWISSVSGLIMYPSDPSAPDTSKCEQLLNEVFQCPRTIFTITHQYTGSWMISRLRYAIGFLYDLCDKSAIKLSPKFTLDTDTDEITFNWK